MLLQGFFSSPWRRALRQPECLQACILCAMRPQDWRSAPAWGHWRFSSDFNGRVTAREGMSLSILRNQRGKPPHLIRPRKVKKSAEDRDQCKYGCRNSKPCRQQPRFCQRELGRNAVRQKSVEYVYRTLEELMAKYDEEES